MTNITLDGLPAKTGTISDAGIIHFREAGVDKKMTVADFLIRISEEYSTDINTFLGAADKAAGRAALGIARRTAVSNANYTILVTDKVVAQTGTMSSARTFTLPAASAFPAGEELIVIDESGTVTSANKISVSRAGSDTIDGATYVDITSGYGFLRLISDGTSKWKVANAFQATESLMGIAEIATQAETNAGTDDSRMVTPLKLKTNIDSRFANSKVQNGYTYLPNGLILQWGYKAASGVTMTVNLPIAFPTAGLNVSGCLTGATQNYQSLVVNNLTTTQFTVYWDNAASGLYWQAIGY